jgi:membrane protease YdiL (CAAX protease family)
LRWFGFILAVTVCFQIARLAQDDPLSWVAFDYLMRAVALVLLAFYPGSHLVFCRESLRLGPRALLLWLFGIGTASYVLVEVGAVVAHALPRTQLGFYPDLRGSIRFLDLTFGLALVAVHEELFFRRFARIAFARLGDGVSTIVATSLIFGFYHWWTGLPNGLVATMIGALLMLLYRKAGALWPAVLVHYVIDLLAFT